MDNIQASLEKLKIDFRDGVTVKDRKYLLTTFKKCFVGSEAVDWLVASGNCQTREEAVDVGGALGTFEHVTREHEFQDSKYFYHFIDRGDLGVNKATGKAFKWSDYVRPVSESGGVSLQPKLPLPDFDAVPEKDVHIAAHVWPIDEHNAKLLDNVHPTGWVDPPTKDSDVFDLVVIGAGAGGLVTSGGAAGVGARVALIESARLGGDCLNVGCVPSKAIIHAAHLAHTLKNTQHLEDAGISIEGGRRAVKVDFGKVMKRIRKVRARISEVDSAARYTKELGVNVFIGHGTFVSDKAIEVNGRTLKFKKAVIATGGYPSLIPMDGLKELYEKAVDNTLPRPAVMTNETFFNLTEQPKHMVVVGAGVIGLELAQSMQRLGTQVTVLGRSGKVLPKEDEDLALLVKKQLARDGVDFRLSVSKYKSIALTGKILDNGHPEIVIQIEEDGKTSKIICDAFLVAAGRKPNVTGMGLEEAGVKYDTKFGLTVNDRLQTTNKNIFGVGDCCSEYKFTHAADFMARMVIRNTLFLGKEQVSSLLIPYATFTDPEIASVGLYAGDLKERGIKFETFEKHFDDNDRAICDDAEVGMVRIRTEVGSDKILGATIVGAGAGNMISEIALAMKSGTGLGALANVIHPYPTTAEAVRQTGDLYNRTKLTSTVRALLRGVIKIQR